MVTDQYNNYFDWIIVVVISLKAQFGVVPLTRDAALV
jgi:hypothetical protein